MTEGRANESYTEEFFRRQYDFEHDRRQKIRTAIAFPAGVLAILGGIVGFYVQLAPPTFSPFWPNGVLGLLLIVLCVVFGWTVYWLIQAYWPLSEQAYIADPEAIYDYLEGLCQHYKDEGCKPEAVDENVEIDLRHFLCVQYVQCAERNSKSNDRRQKCLTFSNLGMIAVIGVLGVSFIPSYFAFHRRDTITKVQVVEPVSVKAPDEINGKRSTKAAGKAKTAAAADQNIEGR